MEDIDSAERLLIFVLNSRTNTHAPWMHTAKAKTLTMIPISPSSAFPAVLWNMLPLLIAMNSVMWLSPIHFLCSPFTESELGMSTIFFPVHTQRAES